MKFIKFLIPIVAIGLAALMPTMRAQDGGQKKKGGMTAEARVAQIDEAVGGLTADQKTKITAIWTKVQTDVAALPQEERQAKGAEMRTAATTQTRALLTDAQKAKFDAMPAPKGGGGGKKQ
jgi:hypothetical protein